MRIRTGHKHDTTTDFPFFVLDGALHLSDLEDRFRLICSHSMDIGFPIRLAFGTTWRADRAVLF